ncbi:hypothetical protein TEA_027865 [Camellia sinensis var. sinensis]|uniref:Major facilitator superfamily (MFS) profile domain-containing protein n=1 Tax=Camellia sinensis var. sinensis TaxID=542762 RepID=A0A4S4D9F0_CAMSN|nr:hypothetical protein TEA_027865 [Camellia sinensis var. sinensis]
MADPTPLILSRTESETPSGIRRVEGDEKYIPPSSSSSTLDETIEQCLGDFGWAQFFQAALVSVAWVFDAQQTFVSVFTDAQPTWHLTTTTGGGDTMMMICQLPRNSWAWDMPIDTSIISEWSLECAGSIMTGLPASSFFMGCLAGGFILATLADSSSLGRKNMLLLSCLLMSLAGLSTVFFSTNIWIYSALRFVSGFGRSTIGTCALVLSTELVGKRWRPQVGIIGFICFTLGFLSLPAIAYFNRGSSWRLLYLWTCVPAIFYCVLFHFLALESPRWLCLRGRKQEFLATLKTLATPAKRSSLMTSSWCWWWRAFQIGLEMISFFSACTAFNVLLIYTIELFPTCVICPRQRGHTNFGFTWFSHELPPILSHSQFQKDFLVMNVLSD